MHGNDEILTLSLQGIGCVKITKAGSEDSSGKGNVESRSYLEKKLVFCFGSYVAAHLLLPFGEENILSSSDLKQAQGVVFSIYLCFSEVFHFYLIMLLHLLATFVSSPF